MPDRKPGSTSMTGVLGHTHPPFASRASARLFRTVSASALALLAVAGQLGAQLPTSCPNPDSLTVGLPEPLADVRYLSDDALEGRAVGSPGARCAADYIASRLRDLGLAPAGPNGTYFQTFTVRTGAALGPHNRLSVDGSTYVLGQDWVPLGFSANASLDGRLVYAGSGLSSADQAYDAYEHLDLTGRIAVVDWGDPDVMNGQPSQRADPHFKATVAAARHAAALVVLLPEGMALPSPQDEIRRQLSIPVVVVAGGAAAEGMRQAAHHDETVRLDTDVHPVERTARNVLASLRGSDPTLRDQYVVVGAHFDHLGRGGAGSGSLSPDVQQIHNGADDNASGVAGLLDVAGRLANGPPLDRSVLFIGFTGEERGLWGSGHFVTRPTIDLSSTVAMLNLDMVGRMTDDALTVFGTGTAKEWDTIVSEANATLSPPLVLSFNPQGYGGSDQTSFYAAGIPVLHFFTNTHADYHRPSDDWEKVNASGIDRVAELASRVASSLAGSLGAPAASLTPVKQPQRSPGAIEGPAARRTPGPWLGTIPDMTPQDFGVRVTGVQPGSPAEKAGMQAGDVIVSFDGRETPDLYAYAYALRGKKPGDKVEIVVDRDGTRLSLTAVLGTRPRP